MTSPPAGDHPVDGLRPDVPHSGRIWNYWLGGKDNYPADQEAGDMVAGLVPGIVDAARASRAFQTRAVQYLVRNAGIRQFLDVGTGLPTANNTHEVAQQIDPTCRIVYVDNDPLILTYARALLTSTRQGATDYIHADAHKPGHILDCASGTLDLSKPVALLLLGILNHIVDDGEAHAIVEQLLGALAPGSYLAIGHPTAEVHGEAMHESMRQFMERGGTPIVARSRRDLEGFFDGMELLEPGVVSCSRWRNETSTHSEPPEVSEFCGLARKPS